MDSVSPKKHLGQNFLINTSIINKIIENFKVEKHQSIIEIGSGTGILSKPILEKYPNHKTILIELDKSLIPQLTMLRKDYHNLQIINKDCLNINYQDLQNNSNLPINFIGNLPYNIASRLIINLLYKSNINWNQMIWTIQYEVAKKAIAKPNDNNRCIFSLAIQAITKPFILFKIHSHNFYPKPKVLSTTLKLIPLEKPLLDNKDFIKWLNFLKALFHSPRKNLKNNLKNFSITPSQINIDFNLRPESISTLEAIKIFNLIKDKI